MKVLEWDGTAQLFGTKGQWDKLKILPRDGMGRDSLSKSGMGWGTGGYDIFTAVPSHGTKRNKAEKEILKLEKDVLKQDFCSCPCPGTKGSVL